MQRAVKVLRIALPLAFVGFLLLVVFSFSSHRQKAAPARRVDVFDARAGDRPQVVAYAFDDTQSIGGRVVSRVRATRTVGFKSGWYTLQDVHLTVYREDGTTYEMVAPSAEFQPQTREASLAGGVTVTSSDGVMIRTPQARFDGNSMVNHVPVEFMIENWRGNAGGVEMNLRGQLLRLVGHVSASLSAPAANAAVARIDAETAAFDRQQSTVTFDRNVRVVRDADTIRADTTVARFDQSRKVLVGLDGSGNVEAHLNADTAVPGGSAAGGEKVIKAGQFASEFAPDGSMRALTASGNRPSVLLTGPPRRHILADILQATFEGGRVNGMQAHGNVLMTEAAPNGARQVHSEQTTIAFDAAAKPTSALLEGGVRVSDPKITATSDRANYDFGNHLVLTSAPGAQPSVSGDGQELKADVITVDVQRQTMKLTKNVFARLSSKSAKRSMTSVFPSSSAPIYVNAQSGTLQKSGQTAFFNGDVRAWQDKNTLLADELLVQNGGELVQASGGVRTVLYNDAPAGKDQGPMFANGEKLVARKNEQKIDISGHVRMEQAGRIITADTAIFHFDRANKLQQVETKGNVKIVEKTTGREGTGEAASYQIAEQKVYLNGAPAVMSDPQGTVRGEQIVLDLSRNKVDVRSDAATSENSYRPQ